MVTFPATANTYTFSGAGVTINGNAMGFDTTKTQCDNTAYLTSETFPWVVTELIIEENMATSLGAALNGYTELPIESCQTLASPGVCGTCLPRYYPNPSACAAYHFGQESPTTCTAPYSYDNDSNQCIGGRLGCDGARNRNSHRNNNS